MPTTPALSTRCESLASNAWVPVTCGVYPRRASRQRRFHAARDLGAAPEAVADAHLGHGLGRPIAHDDGRVREEAILRRWELKAGAGGALVRVVARVVAAAPVHLVACTFQLSIRDARRGSTAPNAQTATRVEGVRRQTLKPRRASKSPERRPRRASPFLPPIFHVLYSARQAQRSTFV